MRQEEIRSIKDSSAWMIATSLISLFSAALLIWILIYIYKQKWVHKHKQKDLMYEQEDSIPFSREARRSTIS